MCRGSTREQSPQHPRSTAPGDHMVGGPCGAMLLVLIISRGLERSTDAALVVAEHEGALDEVRPCAMNSSQWMRSITEVPPAMRDIKAHVYRDLGLHGPS